MERLGQYHRMATVIGYGMIGALLVFAAVVETLKASNYEAGGLLPASTLEVIRYVFLGVAFVEFFVIRMIGRMILSGGGRVSGISNQGDLLLLKVRKLFISAIVSLAFCESVWIYGLMLFLIGGSSFDFYLFIALALAFFAFYFPRYPKWEAWINAGG